MTNEPFSLFKSIGIIIGGIGFLFIALLVMILLAIFIAHDINDGIDFNSIEQEEDESDYTDLT